MTVTGDVMLDPRSTEEVFLFPPSVSLFPGLHKTTGWVSAGWEWAMGGPFFILELNQIKRGDSRNFYYVINIVSQRERERAFNYFLYFFVNSSVNNPLILMIKGGISDAEGVYA